MKIIKTKNQKQNKWKKEKITLEVITIIITIRLK